MPAMKGTNVRMNGKKRPRKMARCPHLSRNFSLFSMRSGVMALTLPEATIRVPKKCPIMKLHWSPRMAATQATPRSAKMLNPPPCAKNPDANSSESPGRNGKNTTPVSTKMMRNTKPYAVRGPAAIQLAMAARGARSRLAMKSTNHIDKLPIQAK